MKKIYYIIFAFIGLFLLHLTIRYVLNEIYIDKYNNEDYNNKIVDFLHIANYPEAYIAHYNKGNNLYKVDNYEEAKDEYNEALKTVKGDRRCKVLINLVFTELNLCANENNEIDVNEIKRIQKILLDSDCATKDNNGKNEDAQKLYNELEEMIENAKGSGQGEDSEDEDGDDGEGEDDSQQKQQEYKDLEEKLKEQQKQSYEERQRVSKREYEYYRGKQW